MDATKGRIIDWLATRYRDWDSGVAVSTQLARLEQTRTAMLMMKIVLGTFAGISLIVDAGIGRPSHAAAVMELGYDAVLLNTAVAKAGDPVAMAAAFGKAIDAGRGAYCAGLLEPRDMAVPSTPIIGMAAFS